MSPNELKQLEQINDNLKTVANAVKSVGETLHKDSSVTSKNTINSKIVSSLEALTKAIESNTKTMSDKMDALNATLKDISDRLPD